MLAAQERVSRFLGYATLMTTMLRYMHLAGDYLAYAHRPMLWPAMARNIASKLTGKIPDRAERARQRAEATKWCHEHLTTPVEALGSLGIDSEVYDVEQLFPQIMAAARQRTAAIPVPTGGAGATNVIYTLCENLRATRVIETGVSCGWSSLAILLSLRNRPDARLYSIDLPNFDHRPRKHWIGAAVPQELRNQWVLYRMADREGLPRALRNAGTLDFAHYDSDKSREGRLFAYPRLWEALKPGGILMSDDIQDNMGFAEFCASRGLKPCVIHKDLTFYAGIVRKG
jgi:predicted O-methyltransferase YrrM